MTGTFLWATARGAGVVSTLTFVALASAVGLGCQAAHSEACVSNTYASCGCEGGLFGTMVCEDGVYAACRCPEPCVRPDVGLGGSCRCAVDTGLGDEGSWYCREDFHYTPCSCERVPRTCERAQRAPCLCAAGGRGWASCGSDAVYDACVCIEPDGGWPDACRPRTCEDFDPMCGEQSDGCGGTLDCGACAAMG